MSASSPRAASGGRCWRNALHFLTEGEASRLDPATRVANRRKAAVVHLAARRSDVLIAPSTRMAERITRILPILRSRVVVRLHPVSADSIPSLPRDPVILCPVLFSPVQADDRPAHGMARSDR